MPSNVIGSNDTFFCQEGDNFIGNNSKVKGKCKKVIGSNNEIYALGVEELIG